MDGKSEYFHTEYLRNSSRSSTDLSVSIAPHGVLYLTIGTGEEKAYITLHEMYRNVFIRKMVRFIAMVEAHEIGEIDLFEGGRFNEKYQNEVVVEYGKMSSSSTVIVLDDSTVGIQLRLFDLSIDMKVIDWLEIMYKIKELNFTEMNMMCINYINTMPLDIDTVDIRGSTNNYNGRFVGHNEYIEDEREISFKASGSKLMQTPGIVGLRNVTKNNKPNGW